MASDLPIEITQLVEEKVSETLPPDIMKENGNSESLPSSSTVEEKSLTPDAERSVVDDNKPRLRVPPKRHVDTYTSSTPPSNKLKSPKRLSTSAGRKAKESLRKQRVEEPSIATRSTKQNKKQEATALSGRLRANACGKCEGCRRADCGSCVYCRDKVKFGGPGRKKQKCLLRHCKEMPVKNRVKKLTPNEKPSASPSATSPSTTKTKPPTLGAAGEPAASNVVKATSNPGTTTNSLSKVQVTAIKLPSKLSGSDVNAVLNAVSKPVAKPGPSQSVSKLSAPVESGESGSAQRRASPRLTAPPIKSGAGWEMKMKCEQCGREKNLSMARTDRFCTRRCVLQWLEEHPDKTPKDAVGNSSSPLFAPSTQPKPKDATQKETGSGGSLSRVLKSLAIDMAAPGTRLHLSNDLSDDESTSEKRSDTNKQSHFTQPAAAAAKRSVVAPQPPAIKKAKKIEKVRAGSPSQSSKSVKFDLGSTSISSAVTVPPPVTFSQSSGLPGSISIVPLNRLSEFVKQQQEKLATSPSIGKDIKIPKGLSRNVDDWSVADVCTYFKSTKDCSEFGSIFKEQEMDGTSLLRLTDQTLFQCLGLPLGKVIKAMSHVNELKRLARQ